MKKEIQKVAGKFAKGAINFIVSQKSSEAEITGKIIEESAETLRTILKPQARTAEENDMLRIYTSSPEIYNKIQNEIFDENCGTSPDCEKIERLYEQAEEIRRDKHIDENKAAAYEYEKEGIRLKNNCITIITLGSTAIGVYTGFRIIKKFI